MNANGLTDAEQAAYEAEYAEYQYEGESRLSAEEKRAAAAHSEFYRLWNNYQIGILTAGEYDKKVRDLLESS